LPFLYSLTRRFAVLALLALLLTLLVAAGPALAASSSFEVETIADLYHITADRTLFHSREKVKEAFGHVVVSAEGKRLACDYLWVDDNSKEIKARGNVVFVDKQTTVEAAELHFNMNTGFGSIFYGRVYNDLYSLRGQLIRRVGDGHYLTTEGEYTTCKDCPESWKLAARNVDLTVEGYAFMDGVFIKIKDIPSLYIPYLIVPVKRERQTGLLFPRIGASSSHGFVFVQPLFLAIDKHQDATIASGIYSDQGARYEAQYRYKGYSGIDGQTDIFYSRDRKYNHNSSDRGAVLSRNEFPLDAHFNMRARFFGTLDRDYTYDFPEDIDFQSRSAIESNVVAQIPFDDFFLSAEARRYQSLISSDQTHFDHSVVQSTPTVHAGLKERHLLGPLYGNVYSRFDNFVRHSGTFTDTNGNGVFDPVLGDTPNAERIRETRRTIFSPEISAPFSVGRYFGFVPSLQYNQINYHFSLPAPSLTNQSATSVSYLRAKVRVSTTFEHVYEVDSDKIAKIKHKVSPFITASFIPRVNRDKSHPFEQQVDLTGGAFDQFDVVPLTNSTDFERFPQGKSLYYGFDSRMIKKQKRPEDLPRPYPFDLLPAARPKTYATPFNRKEEKAIEAERLWDQYNPRYDLYQEFWTLNVAQAFDFLESRDNPLDSKRAFSYLLAKSALNFNDNFSNSLEYRYYPFSQKRDASGFATTFHDTQTFNTSFTWFWQRHLNLRRTHFFERSLSASASLNGQPNPGQSVGATITWSFNDYFTVQGKEDWDIRAHINSDYAINAVLTHPSECWGLAFHWDWNRARSPNLGEVGFQVLLNLDGTGFLGKGSGSTGAGSYFGGT
jgi:lipopolysaccharide assembly outer membrane protein LptD (OstA)